MVAFLSLLCISVSRRAYEQLSITSIPTYYIRLFFMSVVVVNYLLYTDPKVCNTPPYGMEYSNQQPPTPLGTRLPTAILMRIYRLAITFPAAIPLDTTKSIYPPLLQTSSAIRSRLLPTYFETNTFTLRRASLCKRGENSRNPALMPMEHRVHLKTLHLSTYNGARECMNLSLGHAHRNALQVRASCRDRRRRKPQEQQQSCPFCDPSDFPPLLAVFPRLRRVTVDVAASRDSGLIWRAFCKAAVDNEIPIWVACTDVGEGVLQHEERKLGMQVKIVDGKLQRVWGIVKGLGKYEVKRFVFEGVLSDGVRRATRISARLAGDLLRLSWYYDARNWNYDEQVAEARQAKLAARGEHDVHDEQDEHEEHAEESDLDDQVEELESGLPDKGPRSWHRRTLNLRWQTCSWTRDFLTAFNWALRVWLKRDNCDEDPGYVRIVEGCGVSDAFAAERMKRKLLAEFDSIPYRRAVRGGV